MLDIQSGSASRSLDLCVRGATILGALADDLRNEIDKERKWGSVKATLRKGAIEAIRQKLGRAQLLLVLSNQMYSDTLQQQRHEMQLQLATAQHIELHELRTAYTQTLPLDSTTAPYQRRKTSLRSRSKDKTLSRLFKSPRKDPLLRVRVPVWLSTRMLEFYSYSATSGWTFHIKTYNLLPGNPLAFECVRQGDLDGLRMLFAERKASPFDVYHAKIENPSKNTLLAVAAWYSRDEVCRFLVEQGADPNFSPDRFNTTPFQNVLTKIATWPSDRDRKERTSTLRFLGERTNIDINIQEINFRGDVQTFQWIIQNWELDYTQKRKSERINIAFKLARQKPQWDRARLIRTALCGQPIDSMIATAKDDSNMGLINYVAAGISEVLDEMVPDCDYTNVSAYFLDTGDVRFRCQKSGAEYIEKTLLDDNLTLIRELLVAGADLSPITSSNRIKESSLWHALGIDWLFYYKRFSSAQFLAKKALTLRIWLYQLYQSGIDLLAYGETEHHAFCNGTYLRSVSRTGEPLDWEPQEWNLSRNHSTMRLISFSFGPRPEDWKFNWIEPVMNEWSRQFWEMVDHPEWAMPGAWDEEGWD